MDHSIYAALQKLPFSGAVYLERSKDRINLTLGWQDINNSAAITENTLFNIASLSKMYTAIMILQLVEKKAISLEDTITKWVNTRGSFKDVTIEHLLTHTSGIPEYLGSSTAQDIEEILHNKEPYFPAGCGSFYTNTNYVLLAKIIEQTSELSYEDFLQKRIAAPLGLKHTTLTPKAEQTAVGKIFDYVHRKYIAVTDDPLYKAMDTLDKQRAFYGDGGIYSTAGDIAQFLQGFREGRLVSKEMVKRALTPSPLNPHYGYGFVIQDESFGHSGGWYGYSSSCSCSFTGEKVTVFLTNEEMNPAYEQQILDYLNHWQDREEFVAQELSAPKHPNIILNGVDHIEGIYQLADEYQTYFTIKRGMDHLIISFTDQPDTHLFQVEPNLYWIRNTMSYIHIQDQIFIEEGMEIPFQKIS